MTFSFQAFIPEFCSCIPKAFTRSAAHKVVRALCHCDGVCIVCGPYG